MLSQREIQILMLLLQNKEYIELEKICLEFHISNRTLLRELSSIKLEALKYNLEIEKKSKYGVRIVGTLEAKKGLLKKLEKKDFLDYKNKDERKLALIIEILTNDELLKLSYYANKLQVSESTISQDLEKLEEWFLDFNIRIRRIKGVGIELEYDEIDFRKAILKIIDESKKLLYITKEEKNNIQELVLKIYPKIIEELTIESFEMFVEYLTLTLKRVTLGKNLKKDSIKGKVENYNQSEIVEICDELENKYKIDIDEIEKRMIALIFKSRKNRKLISFSDSEVEKEYLLNLIYKMVDRFDSKIAFELKEDREFIDGLITHLKPALLRFKYNIPIKNELKSELLELYPDIFHKTKEAITILENEIGQNISEEEIAFLSFHFGSAVLKLNSKNNLQRKVKIGVVCGSGIGVSSLIKSRLKNIFKDKVEIKTYSNERENFKELEKRDFIITTFEIAKLQVPTIKVDILFNNNQLEKISELVDYYMYAPEKNEEIEINKQERLNGILRETQTIQNILKNFTIYKLDKSLSIYEIISSIGKISGKNEKLSQNIERALIKREELYTQVLKEYKLTFLHAQIDELEEDKFYLIRPTGKRFEDDSLGESEVIVVILMKKYEEQQEMPLKKISIEIFENMDFYNALFKEEEKNIKILIERILDDYLKEYIIKYYN